MTRLGGWRRYCFFKGLIVASCLCTIVLCTNQRGGETYGDLGDEIIPDAPTHTNRKNFIPRGISRSTHEIDEPAIKRNRAGHYVNPLFYRDFTPAPPYRRQYHVPPVRLPVRKISRQYIPPWTKKHIIPPWSKKNVIHRPMVNRSPPPPNNSRRPVNVIARKNVAVIPRSKPAARIPARNKWLPPKPLVVRNKYNKPQGVFKPHFLPKPPKRRVHVQIVPPKRAPIHNARQMGIHSGYVLMPARQQKRQPVQYTHGAARMLKTSPAPVNDRFAEKKHIFLPLSTKHFNKNNIPTNDVASYHLDEIGNLIPDISNPRYFEPQQNKNLLPRPSSSCRIPMKRDGRCPIPVRKTIDTRQNWEKTMYQSAEQNRAHNQRRQQMSQQHELARQLNPPKHAAVARKPILPQGKAKSSQRILFFAHGKAAPPRKQISQPVARGRALAPGTRLPIRGQSPHHAPSMFDVPQISNKVYNYINQRTSHPSTNPKGAINPLLKYIQFHRNHPDPRAKINP